MAGSQRAGEDVVKDKVRKVSRNMPSLKSLMPPESCDTRKHRNVMLVGTVMCVRDKGGQKL